MLAMSVGSDLVPVKVPSISKTWSLSTDASDTHSPQVLSMSDLQFVKGSFRWRERENTLNFDFTIVYWGMFCVFRYCESDTKSYGCDLRCFLHDEFWIAKKVTARLSLFPCSWRDWKSDNICNERTTMMVGSIMLLSVLCRTVAAMRRTSIPKVIMMDRTQSFFYDTLPACCIPKAIMMETRELVYEKVDASPRPHPKIFFDTWLEARIGFRSCWK